MEVFSSLGTSTRLVRGVRWLEGAAESGGCGGGEGLEGGSRERRLWPQLAVGSSPGCLFTQPGQILAGRKGNQNQTGNVEVGGSQDSRNHTPAQLFHSLPAPGGE